MPGYGKRLLWVVAALFLSALVYLGTRSQTETPPAASARELRPLPEVQRQHSGTRVPNWRLTRPRRASPSARASADPGKHCEPYIETGCYGGNVHWFDSCGNPLDLDQECEGFCRDGECIALDWISSCKSPPQGRCEGEVLLVCDAGHDLSIDCAAKGRVCRRGPEGSACVRRDLGPACGFEHPRCQGHVLERCVRGALRETDCRQMGGTCVEQPNAFAICLEHVAKAPPEARAECGPCGCEPTADEGGEECNGVDDDQNGYVDDGVSCGPVTVEVLVGSGSHGERIVDEASLAAELAHANEIFAHSGSQISFQLGDVYDLDAPDPETLSLDDLKEMARSLPEVPDGNEFSVRLIFVARILEDLAPRTGVALPFVTEGCGEILHEGGIRFDHSLVAVAQGRTPTTLAHELGHTLGLCHPHEENRPGRRPAVVDDDGEEQLCGEACQYGGDALCDTPLDSEACQYDPTTCATRCPAGQTPDTSNVMSYYHACRYQFTADQVDVMEHTLALRRAWFACRGGKCSCEPGARQCPLGMSCRPSRDAETGFACGMDGPKLPRDPCNGQADCSSRSMCLTNGRESVCIRPCIETDAECTCVPVRQSELRVCQEDFADSG